jgi:H+/Cl- antiporter ClcA
MAVLTIFRRPLEERRFLATAGAGAGLSAAFNAPLAGVIFVLEELHAGFAPLFIACAMAASMTANSVTSLFFGVKPIFDFREITPLPMEQLPWIILLGVVCGVLGHIFKRGLYLSQDFFEKCRIPVVVRPIIPLLVSIPIGFCLFEVTGGGHNLIESIGHASRPMPELGVLLVTNLLFTVFCYGSGTSGGIFFPLLACGALAGDIFGDLLQLGGFITQGQNLHYMIFGMAGFFAAIVKAPVTGAVLIFEMSGNFNYLGNLVLLSLSAFVTTEIMASRPVYEVLLERMLVGRADAGAKRGR